MSQADRLDLKGIYFGYPSCCVDEYYPGKPESKGFEGTGFACCYACSQKPVAEVRAEIDYNRVCGLEFPREYQGSGDYDAKYMSGFLFRVMLYRELSNQSNQFRLEVIGHYETEVAAAISKALNELREKETRAQHEEFELFKEMARALQQCKAKVDRLMMGASA